MSFQEGAFALTLSNVILNFWTENSCLKSLNHRERSVRMERHSVCALAVLPTSADELEHVFTRSIQGQAVLGATAA